MWQMPKTDWAPNVDYFNVEDYNRIKGNLDYLYELALSMYPGLHWEDMGADKTYTDYGFYADEINRFESNIEHICADTYPFPVGDMRTYEANQPFIDWKELNRIESACLMLYEYLSGQNAGRARLSLVPGRRRFPKC
ncbi:MAG: hypothetical protein J6B85_06040 [Lachnospiraceae bacterium]|nr:hypothetical protein [Lachnospiraceae bacterium]